MKFIAQVLLRIGFICLAFCSVTLQARQLPNNGTITFWDLENGAPHNISTADADVRSLAISPIGDLLAAGNESGFIDLWDLKSGRKLGHLTGHKGAVQSLAFSPDGKTLASGSWDRTIKLWSVASRRLVASLPGNSEEVLSVVFSSDGNLLASAGGDEKVRIWNITTKKVVRALVGHSGKVNSVAFNHDSKFLATGSDDKTIKLWDVLTGSLVRTLTGHSEAVESVSFNPHSNTLASGSRDKTVRVWEIVTGSELLTLTGHISSVDCVLFSPDGKALASGSYDKSVKLWDVDSGREVRNLESHTQRITSLAFRPDGKMLVSSNALNGFENPTLHVLAIGISNYYNSEIPPIDYAAKDAQDFAVALEKLARAEFKRINIQVRIEYQATRMAIALALLRIINEAKPQDVFVLFFAGQASLVLNKDAHEEQLMLYGTDADGIPELLLRDWLTRIEARHQLIILETKDSNRGYESFIRQFATENKALRRLLKRNLIILANAFAEPPIPKLRNRFLTQRLLDGLTGGAAREGGEVTAQGLVEYAKTMDAPLPKEMLRRRGEIVSYSLGEDFQLGRVPKLSPSPPPKSSASIVGNSSANSLAEFEISGRTEQSRTRPSLRVHGRNFDPREYSHFVTRGGIQFGDQLDKISEGPRSSKTYASLAASGVPAKQIAINRKGKDYALFIATNNYANWNALGNAIRDAEDIAKELREYYGFETEIIRNPTLEELVKVLERYDQRHYADADQLFVFFAGHGTYNKFTRQGYLVLSDSHPADKDKLGKSQLSYTDLRNILDNFPCRHIFLVIDACYSGTFDEAIAKTGTYRGGADVPRPEFIERIMQFRTRRYLTSGGNGPVYDGEKDGNSPFAKMLLETLRRYGAGEGYLTISTILFKVQTVTPTPISREWGQDEPGSDFFFLVKRP